MAILFISRFSITDDKKSVFVLIMWKQDKKERETTATIKSSPWTDTYWKRNVQCFILEAASQSYLKQCIWQYSRHMFQDFFIPYE